jgi:alpha-amylase
MTYDTTHFSGTDYDDIAGESAIYKLVGPGHYGWATDVDTENGNADYLLFANYNLSHPAVQADLLNWALWLGSQIKLSGMRLDAVKHFSRSFAVKFIQHLQQSAVGKDYFFIGEYCSANLATLHHYLDYHENPAVALFDFPLQGNMVSVSWDKKPNLLALFPATLASTRPTQAVTFVSNHDTQFRHNRPEQTWVTRVNPAFHAHAYAFVMLQDLASRPCVFFGDLYGTRCPGTAMPPSCEGRLPRLILARKLWAYGRQVSWFDDKACVGWIREGSDRVYVKGALGGESAAGMAVVASVSKTTQRKSMEVGTHRSGERWVDVLGWNEDAVVDEHGSGQFVIQPGRVGVWVAEGAPGMARVMSLRFDEDFYRS